MPSSERVRGVPWKELNVAIGCIGIPQAGKTHRLREHVKRLAKLPGYVLIHDPNGDYPGTWCSSESDVRRHIARGPCKLDTENGLDVVEMALRLAEVNLGRHGIDPRDSASRGRVAPAVVCVLDEVTEVEGLSASSMPRPLKRLYLRRRHLHCAVLWGTQRTSLIPPVLYDCATELDIFRVNDEDVLSRLRRGGVPQEITDAARALPQGECRVYQPWSKSDGHQATEEATGEGD